MAADRNVLFALLAFQNDFIDREELRAGMQAWTQNKDRPVAEVLVDQGVLDRDLVALLDRLVERHIADHGGVDASLAALSATDTAREALADIVDADVQASLSMLTRYSTIGTVRLTGDLSMVALPIDGPSESGGRFRVLRSHARGGLGEVFVAEDLELHRQVALKEIQDRHADDEASRVRFMLEAEITGNLEHPGIVPVYGLGSYPDGRPFYAMRFIKGDSLKDAIVRFHGEPSPNADGPRRTPNYDSLAFRNLLRRFIDVCNAIAYAHSRGVLHRDLKPGNVMLGKFGETLVVDWGLAKVVELNRSASDPARRAAAQEDTLRPASGSKVDETLPGRAIGTPAFMSPEQATGRIDELGPATDVYSLGATLYTLLTGKPPFQQRSMLEILTAVEQGDFPSPKALQPAVPMPLNAICLKAMARLPQQRIASALDLASECERWLADEPVLCHREAGAVRARRWVRKHRTLVGSAAAALAVAAIASTLAAFALESKNRKLLEANQAETSARQAALANLDAAVAAVNSYLDSVADDPQLRQHHLINLRKKLLTDAAPFYAQFARQNAERPELDRARGKALHRLAMIQSMLGQRTEALSSLAESSRALERSAAVSTDGDAASLSLIDHLDERARILRELGRTDDAAAAYRAARQRRLAVVARSPNDSAAQRMLARTDANLASVLLDLRLLDEAAATCRRAIDAQLALAKANPQDSTHAKDLCYSLATQGEIAAAAGNTVDANAAFAQVVERRKRLVLAEPRDLELRREWANALGRLRRLAMESGDAKRAENYGLEESKARSELVALAPLYPNLRHELLQTQLALSVMQRQFGNNDQAIATAEDLLPKLEQLQAEFPDVLDYRVDVASCRHLLGAAYTGPNTLADAEEHLQHEREILEGLLKQQPLNVDFRGRLAGCLGNLANVYAALIRPADALELRRQAVAINEKLSADFPNVERHKVSLGAAYCNLGISHFQDKRPKDAAGWLDKAVQTLTPAATRPQSTAQARQFLCNSHNMRGQVRLQLGQPGAAADDFRAAVGFCDNKLEHYKYETDEAWCSAAAGQHARAIALADKLLRGDPLDGETNYDVALAYALCAKTAGADAAKAKQYADRAMSLLETAAKLGYFKPSEWKAEAGLSALYSRPDFQRLLEAGKR